MIAKSAVTNKEPIIIPAFPGFYHVTFWKENDDNYSSETKPEELTMLRETIIAWIVQPYIRINEEGIVHADDPTPVTCSGAVMEYGFVHDPAGSWVVQHMQTFFSEEAARRHWIEHHTPRAA